MASTGISPAGVLIRILIAVALVLLTYNPSGYSFVHWVLTDLSAFDALKAFSGAVLLVCWVILGKTAHTALGTVGIALSALVLGTLVWLLYDLGMLSTANSSVMTWLALTLVGLILGIGLSWSLIRQRATGQVEVD